MPAFAHLTTFQDPTPRDGPENMALDQAILESACAPVLRAYRWSIPSLSIGYFQRLADIDNPDHLPLVRRWTGGGTVRHGTDWTFSLIVPASHPFSALAPADSYSTIHRALAAALAASGFPHISLSGPRHPNTASLSCFTAPVHHDVMHGTQKIAGGAQRRSKFGLLHQGSIQPISPPPSFLSAFAAHLSTSQSARSPLTDSEWSRAADLVLSRYGTPDWLRKR